MSIRFKNKIDGKSITKVLAILLSLMLIMLSGCSAEKEERGNNKKPETSSSPTGTTSQVEEEEIESSKNALTMDDKIQNGTYNVDANSTLPRSDKDEFRFKYADNLICNSKTGVVQPSEINSTVISKRNAVMNTKSPKYDVKGVTYYISPGGDDNNDGLSPETAKRTLDDLYLEQGDAVLFERNSVFRITEAISAVPYVTYGAYGTGDKPEIYASPKNYAKKSLWTPTNKKNVWRTDFPYGDAGNIVFNHGEDAGVKKQAGIHQLTTNGYFYHNSDDAYLYLYFDKGNPGDYYNDIEICPDVSIFVLSSGVSGVKIDNLTLKYSASHGISCLNANNYVEVTNCIIAWIGGRGNPTRHGNGIQWWNASHDNLVDNCWLYQIFDSAISPQGELGGDYYNFDFINNLIEYSCCSFEMWDYAKNNPVTFDNIRIENNIMRASAYGFGNRSYDDGIRGIEGHIRFDVPANTLGKNGIYILKNIFETSYCSNVKWPNAIMSTGRVQVKGNSIYQSSKHYTVYADIIFDQKEYFVTDQIGLEAAWKAFDSDPLVIKWLD
ncbi:MAG: hypothetical protein IKT38_02520 [Clostridia bacterium]|nr:hypothetical protein [Clostridia bacterium]